MSLFDTDLQTSPRVTVANLNRARGSARRVFEAPVEPIAFKMPPTLTAEIVPFQRPVPVVAPVARPVTHPELDAYGMPAPGAYGMIGKRLLDIVLVVLSAPLWLPLVALFALLVARDGHNPFYTQPRVGRNGDVFRMFKLRSMVPDAEAKLEAHLAADPAARAEWDATQKLKNDPRITRIGRIIRKTSVDELPQLLNVLLGDMSLVGPRPFMVSQDALYDGRAYYRLRPGLTGLWQVAGIGPQRMQFHPARRFRRGLWPDHVPAHRCGRAVAHRGCRVARHRVLIKKNSLLMRPLFAAAVFFETMQQVVPRGQGGLILL